MALDKDHLQEMRNPGVIFISILLFVSLWHIVLEKYIYSLKLTTWSLFISVTHSPGEPYEYQGKVLLYSSPGK